MKRRVDKPLVLYGMGKLGKLAAEIFDRLGIPYAMADKDHPYKTGRDVLVAVCVATSPYHSIFLSLFERGFNDIQPVWDIIEAYPEVGIHNGWRGEWHPKIDYISMALADERSRYDYMVFRQWKIERQEVEGFVPEPLQTREFGSTLGEIYQRKSMIFPTMIYHLEGTHHWSVHNEGLELEILWYHMKRIRKERTSLAVACYHSSDGLWRIPAFLMENLAGYEFKFRLHAYMGLAAYLYCTPEEKL